MRYLFKWQFFGDAFLVTTPPTPQLEQGLVKELLEYLVLPES